ncbi:hypothetical protein P9617_gp36 [Escherichia phage SECphi18]|nr:hypothetical protein P9617_gp36 [Escherichia phage SECphi18]
MKRDKSGTSRFVPPCKTAYLISFIA